MENPVKTDKRTFSLQDFNEVSEKTITDNFLSNSEKLEWMTCSEVHEAYQFQKKFGEQKYELRYLQRACLSCHILK